MRATGLCDLSFYLRRKLELFDEFEGPLARDDNAFAFRNDRFSSADGTIFRIQAAALAAEYDGLTEAEQCHEHAAANQQAAIDKNCPRKWQSTEKGQCIALEEW